MKEVRQKKELRASERAVNKFGRKGEPISLYRLTPEEVMSGILQTPHEAKEQKAVHQKRLRRRL